jgi:oligopeptidase A
MNVVSQTETAAVAPTPNPLLDFSDLPRFDAIRPEHVGAAMDELLAAANQALETVTEESFPAQWKQMASALDVSTERLGRAWGAVGHLNSVADTPELRAAYNAALPRVTEFWTRLGADERLYAKYKAMDPTQLTPEQTQAHRNAMRGFVLGGAELQGAAKERFASIQERQAELSQKFSENALDATDAYAYFASTDALAGVPDDVVQATRAAAEALGKPGHQITLKLPCYLPVMQFGTDRSLRERLYRAYVTRASDQANCAEVPDANKFDNAALIREILALRQEEAQLLGYRDFATLSLVPKMADSPKQVTTFLRDLASKARPYAEQDVADMRAFASQHLGLSDPQPWDWPYIGEQLRQVRYAYSEQDVKPYFTAPKVLEGLFKIVETLFEVAIRPDTAPVWHAGVQFFRIERSTPQGPQLVGQFYLDPGARSGKRGGAWMDDVRARWLRPDTDHLQTPVAHLVCNFAEGVGGKPPLLTHDDVITLFHETGHGLHHLLTRGEELGVSGIHGVEWDAVELPSQFMENYCWEWTVLQGMTAHVDSGAPLPRELFDKMLAAKNFQSGMMALRQIEFSLFDMLLHSEFDPNGPSTAMDLLNEVRREVAVLIPPAWHRFPNSFSHIFAGGYGAGYFSYKWAEVLSADAYAAFEEAGDPFDATVGKRFLDEILAVGGARPAIESFTAFRGREPRVDALLRHSGMIAA